MKQLFAILAVIGLVIVLTFSACIDTTNPAPHPVPPVDTVKVDTTTHTPAKYLAMGSANMYSDAATALAHANSGRSYYFEYGTVILGEKIYETMSTALPVKGGGNWIAISFNGGYTWSAIQVDDNGLILAIQ
jgi:hypothetical protein